MTQYYLNIFSDLLEINPTNPVVTPDPYIERQSLGTNIKMFYRMLRWSIRMNDRIGGLLNAYYLGYLLEERASIPAEQRNVKKYLPSTILSLALECTIFIPLLVYHNF